MKENTTDVIEFTENAEDVLTEVIRCGARKLLAAAVEAEVEEWIEERRESYNRKLCMA